MPRHADGGECVIELLWPGDREAVNGIGHTEENLDHASCPLQLNLSRTLRNFSNTHCPLTFQWRGISLVATNNNDKQH